MYSFHPWSQKGPSRRDRLALVSMLKINKVVIPAAGLGTRFLPATKAQPKEMLPIVDKPAIQYIIEEAIGAGLDDILLITGRGKRTLEDHFDRSFELEYYLESAGKLNELELIRTISNLSSIHYVRQGAPLGLGHAVLAARAHVSEEPFVVMLADDIMEESSNLLERMLSTFYHHGRSVIALKRVARDEISSYGAVGYDEVTEGIVRITKIVEKPTLEEAPSDLAVMGRYVFTSEIFNCLDTTSPGRNGEIQLTDAIAQLSEQQAIYGVIFEDGRYDIGSKLDYLRATVELALKRQDLGPAFREILLDIMARDAGEQLGITIPPGGFAKSDS